MDVIFLIGAVQALVFLILMSWKKNAGFPGRVLKIWFALMVLHLIIVYLSSNEFLNLFPHFVGVRVGFPLLYGPLLLFYTLGLIFEKAKFKWSDGLHFIPFVSIYLLMIPFFNQTAEEKLNIINGLIEFEFKHYTFLVIQIASGPIYISWVLYLLNRHHKSIGDRFSFTEEVEFNWLKYLTIGLLVIWLIVILSNLMFIIFEIDLPLNESHFIYTATTVFILLIGFKGLRHGIIYSQQELVNAHPKQDKKHLSIKEDEVHEIVTDIKRYMDCEKPYLEERLMLSDVAQHLDIPPYKLTRVFNDHLNQSFFNFINTYRIEEFKKKVLDPKNDTFTLIGVAYECGFASKASFNRIFKQLTGETPTEFKKKTSKSH